jgi:hypothetical protein
LLTASEITQLDFNADWIILSVKTLPLATIGADAMPGLARAFYAEHGRSWLPIDGQYERRSKVDRQDIRAHDKNKNIGRQKRFAGYDRDQDDGSPAETHPRYWGPSRLLAKARPVDGMRRMGLAALRTLGGEEVCGTDAWLICERNGSACGSHGRSFRDDI